jgi:hypothetical protein
MTEHRITMDRPGVYRIAAATPPPSLVQRLWRFLLGPGPEPIRFIDTLAAPDEPTTTVAVSLASLRRARLSHQETTP